jgi:hypothetical protein
MRRLNWRTKLILALVGISLVFYLVNYLVFRDLPFMLRLVTLQLAFVPISVILITLFLNGLLVRREKQARLTKMNMVIGTFFSEVGTMLLKAFAGFDPHHEEISRELIVTPDWAEKDFARARTQARNYDYGIDIHQGNLEELRTSLEGKRGFLLRLLENPNLLEHESFTDLLWAISHLSEELDWRADLSGLPAADYAHLANDTKRAYGLLVSEWIAYMHHLKDNYPYLYSLAVRTNPLDPNASPEIK